MPSIGDWTMFLLRWFHFLAGITWIGMLYYFNFVQTPFFATAEAPVRSGMIVGSLVGRGLSHDHAALGPDALLHGRREPLRLLHADRARREGDDARRALRHHGDRGVERALDEAVGGQEDADDGQGHAVGRLRALGGLLRRAQAHLRLIGRSSRDRDRKSTRLNSSHGYISYAVFCLKKKKKNYSQLLLRCR